MSQKIRNKLLDIPQSAKDRFAERNADGMLAAQLFVFYRQFVREKVKRELPFDKVPYRGVFNKNKARFNNLAKLFNSHKIDIDKFIYFLVFDQKCTEKDLKDQLLNARSFTFYANHLQNDKKLENIMKWFLKTVDFIADVCVANGISTSTEFLQMLIKEKKLGQYCLAGKISMYYLVGIPKFDKAIPKLDYFSRCELKKLQDSFEAYYMELNNAFKHRGSSLVNPLSFTNKLIQKKKEKNISK